MTKHHHNSNAPSTALRVALMTISMIMMTLVTTTLMSSAPSAQAETGSQAQRFKLKAKRDADSTYLLGRFSLVVPDQSTEMVTTSSVGFGAISKNRKHAYGVRFMWVPNPPKNPLASEEESYIRMDNAFGPLFDWRYFINPHSKMTFYTVASAGFVFGTPNEASKKFASEAEYEEPTNQVVPVLELGVGVFLSKEFGAENEVFLNPEFGVVPGLSAPYISLSAGFNL